MHRHQHRRGSEEKRRIGGTWAKGGEGGEIYCKRLLEIVKGAPKDIVKI
jgi:hypothetical protein